SRRAMPLRAAARRAAESSRQAGSAGMSSGRQVLVAKDLTRHYEVGGGLLTPSRTLKAVDGASFSLTAGKTLAVVGESGCGKSTLARMVTLIERPTSGTMQLNGVDVTEATGETQRKLRQQVQIVFQDPYGSLNPRQKIGTILEEPLIINRKISADE